MCNCKTISPIPIGDENQMWIQLKIERYFRGKLITETPLPNGKNQKLKHINQIDNNCHIPDLIWAFSYIKNGVLNLAL